MALLTVTENENHTVEPLDVVIFNAADYAKGSFDGTPFDITNLGVLDFINKLVTDGYLRMDNSGCYDYARWELTFGDNKDQIMILGPGDGIVFKSETEYFGLTELAIKTLLNVVYQ